MWNDRTLTACKHCGKERWVLSYTLKRPKYTGLCVDCARSSRNKGKNPNWGDGTFKTSEGYIMVRLYPGDFFYSMARQDHYVYEHRLIVARALGRCLQPWEIVHHKRGYARDNNKYPKTLQLVTDDRHKQITILENKIKYLERKIKQLEVNDAKY